jgi:XTP/dITP diphosphohydrolase
MKVVLATTNRGKVREIKKMLSGLGLELYTLEDFPGVVLPPEDGNTFEENARRKAMSAASQTGLPALADDSGLEVDALSGAPGVRSARYAGPGAGDMDNVEKLLTRLEGVPAEKRTARFVCVAAYAGAGGEVRTFTGRLEGRISTEPAGRGGFGYDPVFFVPALGRTAAELTAKEKNRISHRGKAFGDLRAWIETRSGRG